MSTRAEQPVDIAIVGAGPVGLAATLALATEGRSVALLGPLATPRDGRTVALLDSSWSLLAALDADVDYMLSGGLSADNIAQALKHTRAPGIDISSGVERAPGEKDVRLIEEFFRAVADARMAA